MLNKVAMPVPPIRFNCGTPGQEQSQDRVVNLSVNLLIIIILMEHHEDSKLVSVPLLHAWR